MILISLFAGLTIVGAYISIPIPPVPITFQNLICILSGALLGSKRGAISQLIYMLIGLIGLPVFAGGRGGIQSIFSPTFGYIIGFVLSAYVVGKIIEKNSNNTNKKFILATLTGTFIIYLVGTFYLYGIMRLVVEKPLTFIDSIKVGVLPFLIKDILIAILAAMISKVTIIKIKKVEINYE